MPESEQFLKYVLEKEIHTGFQSSVYSGYDSNHTRIIVKSLRTEHPSEEQEACLKQEYDFLKKLNGDGSVEVYAYQNLLNKNSIIMEAFGTHTLKEYLSEKKKIDIKEFLIIAINIADELEKIHKHNIIHKDIHPNNILINVKDKEIKIIDFGIATILLHENPELINAANFGEGNISYISPEQTGRMNRGIDYRTDFYSLGIVFYQLVTGNLPFDTGDIAEIIHDHIVTIPKTPHEVDATIPVPISRIIMKLIEKIPEERYQTLYGLKEDLRYCQEQLRLKNEIANFPIGKKDVSKHFKISEKIYGRDEEVASLISTFEEACQGKINLALVSGYSGVGKSTLVHELYRPLVIKRGNFIFGKFDQFKKNAPYSAFIQAFEDFTNQLLTKEKKEIEFWRERIQLAIGDNGQVILDVVPMLASIIGKQKTLPILGPTESQNRFTLVFQNFVHALTMDEHPLVIFLDDLQWADLPSIKLIESLMINSESRHLLLICAYRDNEVDENHILMHLIANLKKRDISIKNISVKPLGINDVQQLLLDNLHQLKENITLFADVIYEKTQGNPFFLTQFLQALYKENFIFFNEKEGRWFWDIEQVQNMISSYNVIELMSKKINQLSNDTQHVLMLAACLGNQFDLHTLSIINEKSSRQTAQELWQAIELGLIKPKGDNYRIASNFENAKINYRFLHDRIQQAAYSLIGEHERNALHLKIGRILLKDTPLNTLNDVVIDIVNHINLGEDLIIDGDEKLNVIELNYMAGMKAKTATAYKAAMNYFKNAIRLLKENAWETNYSLTLSIYTAATENAYLAHEFQELELYSNEIFKNAHSSLDKIPAYEIKILHLASQDKPNESFALARSVLESFGVVIPKKDINKFEIFLADLKVKFALLFMNKKKLENLPKITDPTLTAVMRILTCIYMTTLSRYPKIFLIISLKTIGYSIKHGITKYTAMSYMGYALLLWSRNKIKSSYEFSQLALESCERFEAQDEQAKVLYSFNIAISHWRNPLQESIAGLNNAIQMLLSAGSLEHAGFAMFFHDFDIIAYKNRLKSTEIEINKHVRLLHSLGVMNVELYEKINHQFVINMMGDVKNALEFSGPMFDEKKMMPKIIAESMYGCFVILTHYKMVLHYLLGDIKNAYQEACKIRIYSNQPMGTYLSARTYFYRALIGLAFYPQATVSTRKNILKSVRKIQRKFKIWSTHSPSNFSHNYKLIAAEISRLFNDNAKATQYYNEAIQLAAKNNFLLDEAIAYELSAKYFLSQEKQSISKIYMNEAYACYKQWGAQAKVQHLEEHYGELISVNMPSLDAMLKSDSVFSPQWGINLSLDLSAIIKANLAIASEIELDSLLKKLMSLVMQSGGAQSGFLLLQENGQWQIQAQKNPQKDEVITLQSASIEDMLPTSIINYVVRTKQGLALDNALTSQLFSNDPYIQKNRTRSILVLPLVKQENLIGILYLENNLTTKAFTKQRADLLTLLSAQFAISIENVKFFTEIKALNETYSRFVPKEFLRLLNKKKIIDIALGDQIQVEMTVMFCDIRGFTSLSEQMTPQENINFINAFFAHLTPAITKHNGFIVTYIGDAIMAIFPSNADDALHGAIDLFELLDHYNKERALKNRVSIEIGVGLNLGRLMLGTVGDSFHMEGTVISDAVNIASRVEELTKKFHAPLLITETVYNKLTNPEHFSIRKLGNNIVKGKSKAINIYEVFSHESPDQLFLKNLRKENFERAVALFDDNAIDEAYAIFKAILLTNRLDLPAKFYLNKCAKALGIAHQIVKN